MYDGFQLSINGPDCAGNLAFTFTASLARRLAMLAPSQLIQRRSREQLPENLDLMLERDDAKTLLYEARQRLEVSPPKPVSFSTSARMLYCAACCI